MFRPSCAFIALNITRRLFPYWLLALFLLFRIRTGSSRISGIRWISRIVISGCSFRMVLIFSPFI